MDAIPTIRLTVLMILIITTGTQHVCATLQLKIVKTDVNLIYFYFLKWFVSVHKYSLPFLTSIVQV